MMTSACLKRSRIFSSSAGHAVRAFSSAHTLLNSNALPEIDCLIADIGMDGFGLQRLMSERRPRLPVILITGRHEIAELPQAKHNLFFLKPFDAQALLAAIDGALTGKETPLERELSEQYVRPISGRG